MRILLVSQMYPGPAEPDYGVFVRQLELALSERGHEIERAVLTRRAVGSRTKYLELARRTVRAARRLRPDVVYAHFLVPTGLIALLPRAPLVVTAHGQDVANIGAIPGIAGATRAVVARARHVIAVSDYLRRELVRKIPAAAAKTSVVDCGVDLERFAPGDAEDARTRLGWDGDGPAFVCVGYLSERKNVVRLADAFAAFGQGRLAFVGDGPQRPHLEGRPHVRLVGRVPHDEVRRWIAACDVLCQPSLVEPFGQALLEAMASARSVVATRVGGPPEFVPPEAGALVDPASVEAIAEGLRGAAALPRPNDAARAAAARHDVRLQAARVEEILARAARDPRA
jgi:glycosyltransferase involved in cell wall biosynthesis